MKILNKKIRGNYPFIWRIPTNYANKKILRYNHEIRLTEQLIFMLGRNLPFDMKNENFKETMQDPKDYDLILDSAVPMEELLKYDCLPNNMAGGPPIVNSRVLDILNGFCPKDFQYFPIVIRNEKGAKITDFQNHDYFLINIANLVDSINYEKSYVTRSSYGLNIRKLFFKEDCMGKFHLAREKEAKSLRLVSPELEQLFRKEKIKGISFRESLECYYEPFPDEYITQIFPDSPDAAKRFFVSQLNRSEDYEFLKTRIHKIPLDIFEGIIELTLSKSSFHAEQCAELREIMRKHLASKNSNT